MALPATERSADGKRSKPEKETQVDRDSKLFHLYRTIGSVSTCVPAALQYRGTKPCIYLTTSIGYSFHIYDCNKISLLFVGPTFSSPIVSLACWEDFTIVALATEIVLCERAKIIHRVLVQESTKVGRITQLQSFGSSLLVAYENSCIDHFDIPSLDLKLRINLPFTPVHLLHPDTYLDKILVAGPAGELELWNIARNKRIFAFPTVDVSISCMAQSPVVDIIAVARSNGTVSLINIKTNKVLFKISNPANRITALSFRPHESKCHIAVGDDTGAIYLWELNEQRLLHSIPTAHAQAIHTLEFLASSGILLSVAGDNQVKQWVYEDTSSGTPQLLKYRAGHQATSNCLAFYGQEHPILLSGSRDHSLRMFNLERDEQSMEFSQKPLEHSLSPIIHIACNPMKSKQWDDILTCHQGETFAMRWRFEHKRLNPSPLHAPDTSLVGCATISSCGNFALLGTSTGKVFVFNIQSGLLRGSYQTHSKAVNLVLMDSCNKTVVTCSMDSTVSFWSFPSFQLEHSFGLESVAHSGIRCDTNDLIALACDSFSTVLLDTDTKQVVRTLQGHSNRITSLVFSSDGRWIVSGGADGTICTWDIPTGSLIDRFRCDQVPVALAFAPGNDFLLSAHSGSVGLRQWCNKVHYNNASYQTLIEQLECTTLLDDGAVKREGLQFTGQPKSRWETLFVLEQIKQRNKPKAVVKQNEEAPFFLDFNHRKNEPEPVANGESNSTTLQIDNSLFHECMQSGQFEPLLRLIAQSTPSFIDFQLRTLPSSPDYLNPFLDFLIFTLKHGGWYDAVQAWFWIVLDEYSSQITEQWSEYSERLSEICLLINDGIKSVDDKVNESLCLIDFNTRAAK